MCQIDVIRECKKPNLVRRALKTLPKTLDETYERILSNIPDDYVEDVRRVLQCLICSFYPLDVKEVADIVAIDTAEPYYDPENGYSSPRELLSVCSGLVSTRSSWRQGDGMGRSARIEIEELRLAHFSVKEYLVSDRVNLGPALKYKLDEVSCHGTLANLCISYLLQYEEGIYDRQSVTRTGDPEAHESWDEQSEAETDGHFEDKKLCEITPFAPYAAIFWSRHLRAARLDDTTPLYAKSMKLIDDPALLDRIVNHHRYWFDADVDYTLRFFSIRNRRRNPVKYPLSASISPVYYASLLGLDYHVSQLLEAGESADSLGPEGTALAVAASKGHKSTVQLLLKLGADMNAQEVWKKERNITTILTKTALHSAIERGHEDIVHFLLDHGAAVNTKLIADGYSAYVMGNTPLQDALLRNNTSLSRNLLARGADVTAARGHYGDALGIACGFLGGNVFLARLLLEKGADPNASQGWKSNPLTKAIEEKNETLQRLLVEYGADVALVDFDHIRRAWKRRDKMSEKEIEDYFAQTIARLAQVERRPKPSIAMSDSVEERKKQRRS